MFEITRENVHELVERCHGAIMAQWNKLRDRMHLLGYDTQDAKQEVAKRVWENKDNFRGATQNEFCRWSAAIVYHWMVAELRKKRPEQMPSGPEPVHPKQHRPSQEYRQILRWMSYYKAREALPGHELALIGLRYEQDPELSLNRIRARLQREYAELWQRHQGEWGSDEKLKDACTTALQHLNELAHAFNRELEGGSFHESSPE
jgi:hypothetical protein